MKFGYADPPYPGCSDLYRDHEDYAGEVDHAALVARLEADFDGWALHTHSPALWDLLPLIPREGKRIFAWTKTFAAFKRNVSPAYAWEPVIVKPLRKGEPHQSEIVMRDWIAEGITLEKGLAGAKPERVCRWLFETCGLTPDDEIVDLFPGTGAVSKAWEAWRRRLPVGAADSQLALELSEDDGPPRDITDVFRDDDAMQAFGVER